MDEEAATMTSSDAQVRTPSSGADRRLALVHEFPNVKTVSDPRSPNVEDAPSERVGVEERLGELEWENKILPDQAVLAKQTLKKHAKQICKQKRTTRAICN